jgi:tetratricopeptide (TPR) repeat protein
MQQYYPLTGTSFWIDCHLWGFHPLAYHVENLLLHLGAAGLFGVLLKRLRVPGSWFAAAIFALHPVMVQSAGWITERKNVLSLALYLGALLAYGRFAGNWRPGERGQAELEVRRDWRAYALAGLLFLGAMFAKTTAFSFPAVILVICWWKRGRIRWRADVAPTLPFFAVAISMSALTAWIETTHLRTSGPDWALSFPERCVVAGRALCFYAAKLLVPANVTFVYPRWHVDAMSAPQWICPAAVLLVAVALWRTLPEIGRGPLAAAMLYAGTLFPVLGFMNPYGARYSYVWNQWVYVSSLPLIALAAAAVVNAAGRLRRAYLSAGCAICVLPVLAVLTFRQAAQYADADTLWRATLERNPEAFLAHNNLGLSLQRQGDTRGAMDHFQKAIEANPRFAEALDNLGIALFRQGRLDEAAARFQSAVQIEPDDFAGHNDLGNVYLQQDRLEAAESSYRKALKLSPDFLDAHNNLAIVLSREGKLNEADAELEAALRLASAAGDEALVKALKLRLMSNQVRQQFPNARRP